MTAKEKLLHDTYTKFVAISLSGIDANGILDTIVDKDIIGFGTTVDEKVFSFSEFQTMLKTQKEQSQGLNINFKSNPNKHFITDTGNTAVFSDDIMATVILENETVEIYLRFSAVLEYRDNKWIVINFHGSKPEYVDNETDTFGIDIWKQKNAELERLVTERTAEISEKNRELEIETALEKVRSVAMGMTKPADMLEVCKTISHQLQNLGVKDIRNVQTAIFYESKGIYMNYEYYARHNKTIITETNYTNHKIQNEFATTMLKGKGELSFTLLKDKEVKEWLEYQKNTNQFIDTFLEQASSLNYYWYSLGPVAMGISTYVSLHQEDIILFEKFKNVFELAYTRYLDIQQAIAQAKEAQIETSLERVRAIALSLKKPEELTNVSEVLYTELRSLGFDEMRNAMINIHNDEEETFVNYDYSNQLGKSINQLTYTTHPLIEKQMKIIRSADDAFSETIFAGNDLIEMKKFRKSIGEKDDPRIDSANSLHYYFYSIGVGSIGISTFSPLTEEKLLVLKRFRNVFEFAYRRYMDLALAEAQTREAQIETALERTRTQSMIMQHSKELDDTLRVFHEQVQLLGINSAFSFLWLPDEEKDKHIFWAIWNENNNNEIVFKNKAINYPLDRNEPATKQCLIDWKSSEPVFSYAVPPEGVENYFAVWKELLTGATTITPELFPNGLYYIEAFMKYGCFGVMMEKDLNENEKKTLYRFANEFERTYTRFLDLQKAEAQTREAEIELALERVRARTMAMQKSEELTETSFVLFEQFKKLGETSDQISIGIFNEVENVMELYSTVNGLQWKEAAKIDLDEPVVLKKLYAAWKQQKKSLVLDLSGNDLRKYNAYRKKNSGRDYIEKRWVIHAAFFSKGVLTFSITEPHDTIQLLERFANVFEQTYTRFLDLQKAEAQAKEAKIETALEKVRSHSMGMQKSDELKEVIKIVYQQLIQLKINLDHAGFVIDYKYKGDWHFWIADEQDIPSKITHPYFESVWANQFNEAKENGADFFSTHLNFEEKNKFYKELLSYVPELPKASKNFYLNASGLAVSTVLFDDVSLYIENFEGIPYNHEENKILMRFGKVFQQTYTRFLDLQKAEAQAKEAKIENALEKVRSRTLAMQKSDELAESASELFRQMIGLGIEPNRLYITIIHETTDEADFWITDEDGSKLTEAYTSNLNDNGTFIKMYEGWKQQLKHQIIDMQGEELQNYFQYLQDKNVPFKGGLEQKRRVQHLAYFSKGFIGLASPDEQPAETIEILDRFASVFNLTYTRFNDLKIAEAHAIQAEEDLILLQTEKKKAEDALTELKSTQTQLIQSEKMASLGELTAGIAHEIQNPLNFVNNFSEVSAELLAEMQDEINNGHLEDAKEILTDVLQNLEKINHHGKRADAIVKGMLQHSRSSSGKKEPTDLNALCDEYLRLSYHGLRAKDKSFNATMNTDFEENIGKINLIPQDFGRVVLNLLNNAFYAVTEKKHLNDNGYEPTVSITTKKENGKIIISVSDNGNGMPQHIIDKIFQPFFTTKPTGKGTGLGLSLSYDIITKGHGGELKVASKEEVGTTFTIFLNI